MDFEHIVRNTIRKPKVFKVINTGDETTGNIWGVTEEHELPVAWFKDNTDAHCWCMMLNERAETLRKVLKAVKKVVAEESAFKNKEEMRNE